MAEREVSLLKGKEMARILGCRYFEASAKDGGNIEKSFYTIIRQLQKLRKEKALLNNLIDSLP
jgi:GTPase KRas protein